MTVRNWLSRLLLAVSMRLDSGSFKPGECQMQSNGEKIQATAEKLDIETLRLIQRENKDRSGRLDAHSSRLDAKATSLLGFISAIALFLATQKVDGWLKFIAYASLAAASIFAFQAMRVRVFKDAPNPRAFLTEVGRGVEEDALAVVIGAQIVSYEDNQKTHGRKVDHWRYSLILLMLSIFCTVIALTVGGQNGSRQQPSRPESSPAATSSP